MALHPYPASIPPEAWQMLMDAWQGKILDKVEVAHVAWHCVGFAMSKFDDNHGPLIGMSGPRAKVGKREGKAVLAAVIQDPKGAIPWNLIIIIAMEILERIRKELE